MRLAQQKTFFDVQADALMIGARKAEWYDRRQAEEILLWVSIPAIVVRGDGEGRHRAGPIREEPT